MLRQALPVVLLMAAYPGLASPVTDQLPGAKVRGEATFRYLGFRTYQARLYTKGGAPLDWQQDFGLELIYLRAISESDLVEATLRELKRTGRPLPIRDQLSRCYADVARGDRYLAISEGPDRLIFWRNGKQMCTLAYSGIKRHFMQIFLGYNTRSKRFTRRLRGL